MKLVHSALLAIAITGNCFAEDIKITGTIDQSLRLSTPNIASNGISSPIKKIKLLKIELSKQARETLMAKTNSSIQYDDFDSNAQDLGMGNVPVLDQGAHGTCVTFATTAAINAALNKGNYLSQLCQLQLGNYLANNGYGLSGWDGSWGHTVLNQMETFGVVSLEKQKEVGCAGLKEYPLNNDFGTKAVMNPKEYHQLSEDISQQVVWSPLLDVYESLDPDLDSSLILKKVKASINAGDRLTFGVILTDLEKGIAGAVGKNKKDNDSWILTPEILRHLKNGNPQFGGHEMVIIGYDDNAIAKDKEGEIHEGLLHIRNSWGQNVGDNGDFYMSYNYFKLFALEVSRIRTVSSFGEGEDAA